MSVSRNAFALYLAGYSFNEIDEALQLHKGRAQLCVLHISIEWRESYDYSKATTTDKRTALWY